VTATPPRAPLAVCFGGGGAFGFGFDMGVADGLRDRGFDLRRPALLGTSAGSHTAAAIDTGLTFDEVATSWARAVDGARRFRRSSGIDLAGPIYGERGTTDVGAVAVRLLTLRRRVLSSAEYPLADIVAASSSVPLLVRPHRIDGKRYVDGGAVSIASIDLAPAADLLLAITPFAVKELGLGGRIGAFQAEREIRRWNERHRGSVIHVVPSPAMTAHGGRRLRDLGDMRIGRAVYPEAVELGRHVGDVIHRDHPDVAARATT
jgi:predicted acylesterase/phospholipase RssA